MALKAAFSHAPAPAGFAILRDQKPHCTPRERDLIVPTAELAAALVAEGMAAGEKPDFAHMPMTQLAFTACDIVAPHRDTVVREVAAYGANDLLCHYAAQPDALIERQKIVWQPILNWAMKRFDALLKTGSGIMPIAQAPASLVALHKVVAAYDDFRLTGLRQAVDVSGSLLLGLALAEKHLDVETVFAAAELESLFQAEQWGEDPATHKRHASVKNDLAQCKKWFSLLD